MEKIRAKKALGQNFLVDGNIIDAIVRAADVGSDESILEIGPGRGALTSRLCQRAARVVAVELDRELISFLKDQPEIKESVEVVHGDILRVDLPGLLASASPEKWKVVGNLPYNISSQVLFRFIENRSMFSQLIFMLQKEVGERLLAPPSCKDYGVLTVLCRLVFDIEKVFLVRPSSFRPVPKVDSMVLRFNVLPGNRLDVGDEKLFKTLVKASFGQRRKTLSNCLKSIDFLSCSKEVIPRIFERSGIDGGRRGETLSLEEFACLAKAVLSLRQEAVSDGSP